MKYLINICLLLILMNFSYAQKDSISSRVYLPNGWSLTPIGRSIPLGDLPLNLVVSPSKKYLAVTNNGQSVQTIQLIDPAKGKLLSEIIIPESWLGLAFSQDENWLYASGGNDNLIVKYRISGDHQLVESDKIK